MLEDFVFHHIGIATGSIGATAALYIQGGYRRSDTIYDPRQKVNVCWLTKEGMPIVELLEPVNETSPINRILEKSGVSPYHLCYRVENIENAIKRLRALRYVTVSQPVEAIAFNGSRVAFFFNPDIGLIELVESPAIISDGNVCI